MKEPLVLLPGMMCDGRLFAPQIAALSATMAIMVVPLESQNTTEGLASDVLAVAPPYFALAGLSMGGIVAMEMVRQAPDRVKRLALMDTNPLPDPPDKATIRQAQVQKVQNGKLHEVMRDEMKPNYLADGPERTRILDLCMEMATTLGPDVFVRQSQAVQTRTDQVDTLRKVRVPMLVLCGAEDTLCPPARHEFMSSLTPNAYLRIIDGAGHLPTLEQPDETNEALREWLYL